MAIDDAVRWNERYRNNPEKWKQEPRSMLRNYKELIPRQGLAIDLAMGFGNNSKFLLDRGLKVIGIDISSQAVYEAKKQNPELLAVIADLSNLCLGKLKVDVILNFYYLQRELFVLFPK